MIMLPSARTPGEPRSALIPAGLPRWESLDDVNWDNPRERDLEESFCWHMYAMNHDMLRQFPLPSGCTPDVIVFPRTERYRLDIVEVKRDVADRSALGQVLDYMAEIRSVYGGASYNRRTDLRGVLVAPRLVVRLDPSLPVRFVRIDPITFELGRYEPEVNSR